MIHNETTQRGRLFRVLTCGNGSSSVSEVRGPPDIDLRIQTLWATVMTGIKYTPNIS
jgi:hypothetical protein